MASSPELEVDPERPAQAVDFRTLLLGAWPDGSQEGNEDQSEPPTSEPPPEIAPADDLQWITWSDASAESAWAAIEIALTLGATAPPRLR